MPPKFCPGEANPDRWVRFRLILVPTEPYEALLNPFTFLEGIDLQPSLQ